ncbi:hypothetical protein FRC09_004734 [Ceratobasidium sp. 395]|nr:hypothetical protein FRC09_004734 [Ceratobasidium sp. 395]
MNQFAFAQPSGGCGLLGGDGGLNVEHKFLPREFEYKGRMRSWDEQGVEIPPDVQEGEKEILVEFHNKCTYKAHNQQFTQWMHEDEAAGLYKKGEGVLLMVLHHVSPNDGFLKKKLAEKGSERDDVRSSLNDSDAKDKGMGRDAQ